MRYNVLYLSYDGMTDPLGQSQVLPYLKILSNHYDIYIHSFEKPERLLLIENIHEEIKGFNISWTYSVYTKNPPVISKLIDLIKFKYRTNLIVKEKNISIIHCRGHYFTSLIGLRLKKRINAKYIFDMRGFWADERIDGQIWNLKNPLHYLLFQYFKKKEKEFILNADSLVVLTKAAKKEINSWNIINKDLIDVIPCCTDSDLFRIENIHPERKILEIDANKFVLSYIGSIGTWYMLDEMLEFFIELNKKVDSIFLFVTKDNPDKIIKVAVKLGISKDKIKIVSSERKMMPSYIGVSDCSIFFILPCYSKIGSSPTKMGEIMNLGIPIVCNPGVGDVEEIMEKTMPQILVKTFTQNAYKSAVNNLIKTNFNKTKIINTSHEIYSLQLGSRKYIEIYSELLNKP